MDAETSAETKPEKRINWGAMAFVVAWVVAICLFVPQAKLLWIIFAIAVLMVALFNAPLVLLGLVFGVEIEEIGVLMGPAMLRFRVGTCKIRINCIPPPGSYVKYRGMEVDDEPTPGSFRALNVWQRLSIALSPLPVLAAVAVIAIGPQSALHKFSVTFSLLFQGALHPQAVAVPAWQRFFALVESRNFAAAIGTIASVMAAMNYLPLIGMTNGGQMVIEVIQAVKRSPVRPVIVALCAIVGMFLVLAISLAWFYALKFVLFPT